MTIRFEPCPVHEPTGVEYEKPCVFNDETGRWACAVCGAEGEFRPEAKLTSPRQHVAPEGGNKVMSAAVFEAGIEALAEVLESAKANGDVTVTVKCFEGEES